MATVASVLNESTVDRRDARRLLGWVAGLSETALLARPERLLEPETIARFRDQQARRRAGEPLAYLIGSREFFGLPITVDAAVLVPRPETEQLVECALDVLPVDSGARVLELGTGSGAVALAIKAHRPRVRIVATDLSRGALAVARANGARLDLAVDWRCGSWFAGLEGEAFDLIVSNPPYIALGDSHLPDLSYEPALALVGGPDGLQCLREIIGHGLRHLTPGGTILLEHGWNQSSEVGELLRQAGFSDYATWTDLGGHPRVTGARRIDRSDEQR